MVVNEATDMSSNRTSKFEAPDSFKCECCGYKTRQSAINHRHYESDRHLRVQNFSTQVNCKNNKNDFCTDSATQAQPTDSFVDGATVDQDHYDEDLEENEAVDDEDEQEYYEERSRDTRTDIMTLFCTAEPLKQPSKTPSPSVKSTITTTCTADLASYLPFDVDEVNEYEAFSPEIGSPTRQVLEREVVAMAKDEEVMESILPQLLGQDPLVIVAT
ncbi:unnamed protein product [Mytilus edulis]|uniref:Uncharacterized protein n=1 Tax=Mytilus edulis TaxID=6550 RepID=A0A8S3VK25_MYTED|nr:unnamed protein product [Mytilus edulis]